MMRNVTRPPWLANLVRLAERPRPAGVPTPPRAKRTVHQTGLRLKVSTAPVADENADELKGKGIAGAARIRERKRCQAIMTHPLAARHNALAAQLAFSSSLPRATAIALLEKAGDKAPAKSPSQLSTKAIDALWTAALRRCAVTERKP